MNGTRFATPEDLESILDYLEKNPYDLKKEVNFTIDEKKLYIKKILESKSIDNSKFLYKIIIHLENSKIVGLIHLLLFKFINQYFLYGLKASTKNTYYKLKGTVIEELYNYAITYAESIGYYSYYAVAAESSAKKKTEIAYRDLDKLKRYEMYIIGYIDIEQIPYYDILKIIRPKKTMTKVIVRNFLLKQEFRSEVNLSNLPQF